MNFTNTQIISLYDSEPSSTIDDLAIAFDFSVESVKLILAAGSQRYKKELAENPETFTADDARLAAQTIKELCYAENEGVRLKAATILLDEQKGRRNPLKNAQKVGVLNINILNNYLNKGQEALKRAKGETVDV